MLVYSSFCMFVWKVPRSINSILLRSTVYAGSFTPSCELSVYVKMYEISLGILAICFVHGDLGHANLHGISTIIIFLFLFYCHGCLWPCYGWSFLCYFYSLFLYLFCSWRFKTKLTCMDLWHFYFWLVCLFVFILRPHFFVVAWDFGIYHFAWICLRHNVNSFFNTNWATMFSLSTTLKPGNIYCSNIP